MHIMNGCVESDKNGNYTRVASTGESVADYLLATKHILYCDKIFCKFRSSDWPCRIGSHASMFRNIA